MGTTSTRYRWTDGQKADMARRYADGYSIQDIADHFGVSSETIRYHLRRQGVTLRGRGMQTDRARKKYSGPRHHGWKGGRTVDSGGYVRVLCREHPGADRDGYVLEHWLVMERHLVDSAKDHPALALGRVDWRHWVAHHRNGDKADNRLENLELLPRSAHHSWMHYHDEIARLRSLLVANGIEH